MNYTQFCIIIFIVEIAISAMIEILLFAICDEIEEIKKILEKYVNQESTKGE